MERTQKISFSNKEIISENREESRHTSNWSQTLGRKLIKASNLNLPKMVMDSFVKLTNKQLVGIANKRQVNIFSSVRYVQDPGDKKLFGLFNRFLLQVDDIRSIANDLGYDYDDDDEFKYDIDDAVEEKSLTDEDVSRKDVEQKYIAREIADIYSIKYIQGDDFFPNDILLDIMKFHAKEVEGKSEKLHKKLSSAMKVVKKRLQKAIEDGRLPLSEDVLDSELGSAKVLIMDDMVSDLKEVYGEYSTSSHEIYIRLDIPESKMLSTLIHEALHAVSGKIFVLSYDHLTSSKVGLGLGKATSDFDSSLQYDFRWLDEGVTERITIELSDEEEKNYAYPAERELLDMLISTGINNESIYSAYFENYEEKKGEHRTPELKKLMKEVNDIVGQGFLISLGMYISHTEKKHGIKGSQAVKMVVDDWKEKGDSFTGFIVKKSW